MLALRFWMQCKAQTAAVTGLRRGFATQQCAKIRKWQRREELISVSLVTLFSISKPQPPLRLFFKETLNNSSSQAGTAVRDGLLGANRSNSGAIARICQNP